jgi:hypothetical protein
LTTTPNLGLYRVPESQAERDTTNFNTKTMLNENWDKIDKNTVRQPFLLKSSTYDSVNNKIDVTLGPGIADFLQTIISKTVDIVYSIATPTINTSYYIYIKSDGTFTHNTTGAEVDGAVKLWIVATGSTVDVITTTDQRGQVSGSAQVVKDLLDAHEAALDPHSQYALDTDAPNAHKASHAIGGADVLTPADIGAETPSGAQTKADQAETDAKNASYPNHGKKDGIDLNTLLLKGYYEIQSTCTNIPEANWGSLWVGFISNTNWVQQLWIGQNGQTWTRRSYDSGGGVRTWEAWRKMWNSGNDGAGSGLDADTVDGKHASDFASDNGVTSGTTTDANYLSIMLGGH